VAVLEYDGKTYYHHTEDPGFAGSRKTEAAKARDQRKIAVAEARDLLKNPVKLHAKQESETKVLDSLNNAAYKLSLSVCKARSVGNTHAMRNYRRKKSQIRKLYTALSDRATRDASLEEESHGPEYPDPVNVPYELSLKVESSYELKKRLKEAIMNEFWARTMKHPAHFPCCKSAMTNGRIPLQPVMLVSVNHITTGDNVGPNKFATLPSEVPAPHSDQLQQ
jgi:hypothetical protein